MALFQFDPVGEHVVAEYRRAQMELALIVGGAKALDAAVRPGIRVYKRDLPAGPTGDEAAAPRQPYCTPSQFIEATAEEIGAANTTRLIRRGAPSKELEREVQDRRSMLEGQYAACVAEIEAVRRKFHPDYDIADVEDGPPEYAAEVRACLKRCFPPLMTRKRLLADLEKYSRKLAMLVRGPMVPAERDEMRARAAYFEYWAARLRLDNDPDLLDPERIAPHAVRCYLKALGDSLRASFTTAQTHETADSVKVESTRAATPGSTAAPDGKANGLYPPSTVRFGGAECDSLSKTEFAICTHMWNRESEDIEHVHHKGGSAIWRKPFNPSRDADKVSAALSRLNQKLLQSGIRLEFRLKNKAIVKRLY